MCIRDRFKLYTKMFGKGDKFIKGTFTVDTTMSYSALISELQTVSTAVSYTHLPLHRLQYIQGKPHSAAWRKA